MNKVILSAVAAVALFVTPAMAGSYGHGSPYYGSSSSYYGGYTSGYAANHGYYQHIGNIDLRSNFNTQPAYAQTLTYSHKHRHSHSYSAPNYTYVSQPYTLPTHTYSTPSYSYPSYTYATPTYTSASYVSQPYTLPSYNYTSPSYSYATSSSSCGVSSYTPNYNTYYPSVVQTQPYTCSASASCSC